MEKQVKVVVSKKEPQNKHVLWLEQDSLHEISPKLFNNGEWQNLKTVNVPEEVTKKLTDVEDTLEDLKKGEGNEGFVSINGNQTITGVKTFASPINLGNHSTIKTDNNGELKVTHNNSEKGFIVKTNWNDKKNILPLEILTTNGTDASYNYIFPEKSGTVAIDEDVQTFKSDVNTSLLLETQQRSVSDSALGNRINSLKKEFETSTISTIDISELDSLNFVLHIALGRADYWVTKKMGSADIIIGRLFLLEDPLLHKVTQILISNQIFDDDYPNSGHDKEGLTIGYRFYGHTTNDVPLKQWTSWKKLYDSSSDNIEDTIKDIQNNIELNKFLTDIAIDNVNNRVTNVMGTPKVDAIEEGNKSLEFGSTNLGYTIVFLSDIKCFAAKTSSGYYPNWENYSPYPSAISYGIQDININNGAPNPIVGRLYSINDELYLWNGYDFIIQSKVDEKITNAIAKVISNAPEDLDTLKEVADYIASDKTKAAEIETAISNLQKKEKEYGEVIAHNTGAIANNVQAIDLLAEEVETKAPKVGYAPDLKVDFAKELVGRGVADPQEIGTIRPTGLISIGDGNATIEKVKGKSVVWNQLVANNITFTRAKTTDNVNFSPSIDTGSGNIYNTITDGIDGHTYLCIGAITNSINATPTCGGKPLGTLFKKIGPILLYPFGSGTPLTIEDTATITQRITFHDLTQMFGAGNEPTTIEEFEARKPLGVTDEYNEGEIISYDGANELKSVGFNAFNGTYAKVIGGQQYHALGTITSIGFTTELGGETTAITLDSEGMFTPSETGYVYAEGSDICIHLTHTYTPEHTTEYEEDILTLPDVKSIKDKNGNQLFPYGLASAGSAHDEITATKAVKRIGVVDLGTLTWYTQVTANGNTRFLADLSGIKRPLQSSEMGNVLTPKYQTYSADKVYLENVGIAVDVEQYKALSVYDPNYTEKDSFKQAMQGVILYYELAEPIEVDLPEPLNLTYDAWDFGTEELIAEGVTTPLNADIVYQFNAVDRIRENTAKNQALEAELAELKAQLTQLTQVSE